MRCARHRERRRCPVWSRHRRPTTNGGENGTSAPHTAHQYAVLVGKCSWKMRGLEEFFFFILMTQKCVYARTLALIQGANEQSPTRPFPRGPYGVKLGRGNLLHGTPQPMRMISALPKGPSLTLRCSEPAIFWIVHYSASDDRLELTVARVRNPNVEDQNEIRST